jgi:hypothetical protein
MLKLYIALLFKTIHFLLIAETQAALRAGADRAMNLARAAWFPARLRISVLPLRFRRKKKAKRHGIGVLFPKNERKWLFI